MLSFEHVNFSMNEKYSKKHFDIPNYYVSFVIFQIYRNQFEGVWIHLGGSFDYVFTHFEFSKF
jgi:hypothetical protein